MTTAEALRAAMALIEDESKWCRKVHARDENGKSISPFSTKATRWCADGGLVKRCKSRRELYESAADLLNEVAVDIYRCDDFIQLNDDLGHAAVMECYREAIRRAEAAEAQP